MSVSFDLHNRWASIYVTLHLEYIANGFYANFYEKAFDVASVPWPKLTTFTYGFMYVCINCYLNEQMANPASFISPVPTANYSDITLSLSDAEAISKAVTEAEKHVSSSMFTFMYLYLQ